MGSELYDMGSELHGSEDAVNIALTQTQGFRRDLHVFARCHEAVPWLLSISSIPNSVYSIHRKSRWRMLIS